MYYGVLSSNIPYLEEYYFRALFGGRKTKNAESLSLIFIPVLKFVPRLNFLGLKVFISNCSTQVYFSIYFLYFFSYRWTWDIMSQFFRISRNIYFCCFTISCLLNSFNFIVFNVKNLSYHKLLNLKSLNSLHFVLLQVLKNRNFIVSSILINTWLQLWELHYMLFKTMF